MFTYLSMTAVLILPLSLLLLYFVLSKCVIKKADFSVFVIANCFWMILVLLITEILSFFRILNYSGLIISWSVVVAILCGVLISNYHIKKESIILFHSHVIYWKYMFLLLPVLLLLFMSVVIPPNNYDSMIYHCARIAHWAQNNSVNHYATHSLEQVASPIFTEYINLHVYILMSRHDHFLNLLQTLSYLVSGIVVMKISEKLGAEYKIRYLAMLIFYAMPIAFAESLTTQVDNVAALLMLYFVYLIIDFWNLKLVDLKLLENLLKFICISILIGTGYLVKPSICVGMAVFMIGILIQLIQNHEKILNICGVVLLSAFIVLVLISPQIIRNYITFLAFSPEAVGQRQLVGTLNPALLLVNFFKNFSMNMINRLIVIRPFLESFIYVLAGALGINADDFSISENGLQFNLDINDPMMPHHDTATNPLIFVSFIVLSFIYIKGCKYIEPRYSRLVKRYFIETVLSVFIFFTILRWENYVTRYEISYLALMCPFIAVGISRFITNEKIKYIAIGIVSFMAICDLILLYQYNFDSVRKSLENREEAYFLSYNGAYKPREGAVRIIKENGYETVGFCNYTNGIEYTIWAMLRNNDVQIESVMVENETGIYENNSFTPDCILCIWDEDIESFNYHDVEYTKIYSGSEDTYLFERKN